MNNFSWLLHMRRKITKCVLTSSFGYTLPPGLFEISDINLMLKSLFLDELKVDNKIDDIRVRSNLCTSKTIKFRKKIFFGYKFRFQSIKLRSLGDTESFVQLILGKSKSD